MAAERGKERGPSAAAGEGGMGVGSEEKAEEEEERRLGFMKEVAASILGSRGNVKWRRRRKRRV